MECIESTWEEAPLGSTCHTIGFCSGGKYEWVVLARANGWKTGTAVVAFVYRPQWLGDEYDGRKASFATAGPCHIRAT